MTVYVKTAVLRLMSREEADKLSSLGIQIIGPAPFTAEDIADGVVPLVVQGDMFPERARGHRIKEYWLHSDGVVKQWPF